MKIIPRLVCLLFAFISLFTPPCFAQNPVITADSLSVEWEQLDGPPGAVFEYAEINGKVFAATANALFMSNNSGETWKLNKNLGYCHLLDLFTVGDTVFVLAGERLGSTNHFVYRSTDKGNS